MLDPSKTFKRGTGPLISDTLKQEDAVGHSGRTHQGKTGPAESPVPLNEATLTFPPPSVKLASLTEPTVPFNPPDGIGLPHPERTRKWETIRQSVDQIVDGAGRPIDLQIRDAVAGLNALGFPTLSSCEGHADRVGSAPEVTVGVGRGVLSMRYMGQERVSRELLAEEGIPLSLRLKHPLLVGFRSLTPEILEALDSPGYRKRYAELWGRCGTLCSQSELSVINTEAAIQFRAGRPPAPPALTPEAQRDDEANQELLRRAQLLVGAFNASREASESVRIQASGQSGLPFTIRSGPESPAVDPNAPQERDKLLRLQQDEMSAFSRFLRAAFLGLEDNSSEVYEMFRRERRVSIAPAARFHT